MARRDTFVSWETLREKLPPDEVPEYEAGRREARLSMNLAMLVYDLRKDAGLTQQQLAEKMGTTQSAISRMESSGTIPTIEILCRLGDAVGVQLAIDYGHGKRIPLNVA